MTARDLGPVIAEDLCIGCGACALADPDVRLELNADKGMYEPTSLGGPEAAAVCPSVQVDFEGLQARLFPDERPGPLGVVRSITLAQSTCRERNLRASSGGLIKELLRALLRRDDVDGAIVLASVDGLAFEPTLATDPDAVDALPGSIYHSVSFERALRILDSGEGRFVVVAIPCQLEGLWSWIFRQRPELAERVYTTIGLICGWMYTHHALRAICDLKQLPFDEIRGVSFRGDGPVGPLRLELAAESVALPRRDDFDYAVAFDRTFNVPRCHLCVDHLNYLAEIVVGDAWVERAARTETGVSLVVCRTDAAVETLKQLEADGAIRQLPAGEADVVESQSRSFTYGDFAYAYAEARAQSGVFAPDMIGPNRGAARLARPRDVKRFERRRRAALRLQRAGRYRALRWRKRMRGRIERRLVRLRRWLGLAPEPPSEPANRGPDVSGEGFW